MIVTAGCDNLATFFANSRLLSRTLDDSVSAELGTKRTCPRIVVFRQRDESMLPAAFLFLL
jgi:hypothetical protein